MDQRLPLLIRYTGKKRLPYCSKLAATKETSTLVENSMILFLIPTCIIMTTCSTPVSLRCMQCAGPLWILAWCLIAYRARICLCGIHF
uniref:Uncharacterized protein n=1 Tax=Rhizophora mucronata TaxID=61149 RepID=A0A2P2Q4G8_RHIMU